jgi:phosphatidylglycerophosphate synthase
VPPVRLGPIIGLIFQVLLLVVLSAAVDLGTVGWIAGLAYAAVLCALLIRAMATAGTVAFGPADRVTSTRAALGGCVTALTAASFTRHIPLAVLVAITIVALVLDAVDGQVARRSGTASAFGARFDMETDAFLILILSISAAGTFGWWVLAIGGMRYAYVAASWVLRWIRGSLPPRYWRKVVAAIQGIVLVTAVADALPRPLVVAALLVALGLLVESFGRDLVWLWVRRHTTALPLPTVPVPAGQAASTERVRA